MTASLLAEEQFYFGCAGKDDDVIDSAKITGLFDHDAVPV
jgi:hypothetical protein